MSDGAVRKKEEKRKKERKKERKWFGQSGQLDKWIHGMSGQVGAKKHMGNKGKRVMTSKRWSTHTVDSLV